MVKPSRIDPIPSGVATRGGNHSDSEKKTGVENRWLVMSSFNEVLYKERGCIRSQSGSGPVICEEKAHGMLGNA